MKRSLLLFLVLALGSFSITKAQFTHIRENFEGFPNTVTSVPFKGWSSQVISGDSSVDRFQFNNSVGYDIPIPLSGQAALVDAYNGGFPNAGGNNVNVQEITLLTPTFDASSYSTLFIEWDELFMQLNAANTFVDVSTNGGSTWTTVYSNAAGSFFGRRQTLTLSAFAGSSSTRIRFRWTKPASATHGYWLIDNVHVYSRVATDVTISSITNPQNNACPSASQPLGVRVTNFGTASVGSFGVNLNVTGGASGSFSTTVGSLAAGASIDVFTSNTINTNAGGNVNFVAIANLSGDLVRSNDTLRSTVVTAPRPSDPTGTTITKCGAGPVTLQLTAQPGEETVWYENATTTTALGSGNPFVTPYVVGGSRQFFAENTRNLPSFFSSGLTGVYRFNTNAEKALFFNITAINEIILDSFQTNFAYAGTHICSLYTRVGGYIGQTTNVGAWTLRGVDTVVSAGLGRRVTIRRSAGRVGANVTIGVCITAKLIGGGLPEFAFKLGNTDLSNPDLRVVSDLVSQQVWTATLGGYSGDLGIFYRKVCKSPRGPVDVVIIPRPVGVGFSQGNIFKGFYNAGIETSPDYARVNDTLRYSLNAPSGFTNAQFGTGWVVTNFSFTTKTGVAVPSADTSTTLPSGAAAGTLTFIPKAADSLYRIMVTVLNMSTMCDTTVERWVYVAPEPKAGFSVGAVCFGEDAEFANLSSVNPGTLNFKWFFGTGDSSETFEPRFRYAAPGSYNVRLEVLSNFGFRSVYDSTIVVYQIPAADFDVQNACEGDAVQFTDRSFIPQGTPSYEWDFGDGSAMGSGANPSKQYAAIGSYFVSMRVTANGCSNTRLKVATYSPRTRPDFTVLSECDNKSISFTNNTSLSNGSFGSVWKFGDGNERAGRNVAHQYANFGTYTATLVTTTEIGCRDSISRTVQVLEAPAPDFTVNNNCANVDIVFNNQTNVPAGGANNYTWNFGNGQTSTSTNPIMNYTSSGVYNVTLDVTNSNGCTGSITLPITIDVKPVADFLANNVCEGRIVQFRNNSVNVDQGVRYTWNLDNGFTTNAVDTSILYSSAGTKNILLVAVTGNGCADSAIGTVEVFTNPPATFTASSAARGDGTMSFSGPSLAGASYQWFLGDGAKYAVRDFDHQYILDGNYDVRLIVTSQQGCTNESTQRVSVLRTNVANTSAENISVYPNPSKGQITIDMSKTTEKSGLILIKDIQGKDLISFALNGEIKQTIDLSALAKGQYLVVVQTANQSYQARVSIIQ